jgi:hypothetical protein
VRAGYARYRLVEPTRSRWLGSALTGLVTEVRLPLGRTWELSVAPGCVSFYLQGALWGVVLEPAVGVARRW